jgi:hypothetical protein
MLERMKALVRRMAQPQGLGNETSFNDEARAIVAEMTPPVDPDYQAARNIVDGRGINPDDPEYYAAIGIADEAIKWARANP